MSTAFLHELLSHLEANRGFPKYQYERRIDAFISFFLPDVLKARFGVVCTVRIPEFPVKKFDSNLCENADYLIFDEQTATLWLVELKTDAGSVKPSQLDYYNRALTDSWDALCAEVQQIRGRSAHGTKYDVVLNQMQKCQDIKGRRAIYLAPKVAEKSFRIALDKSAEPVRTLWEFLSLEDFADTKVETRFPEEWQALAEHIRGVLAQ
jgi:hypothetical protein